MGKKPVNRRRSPRPQHHPDYIRLRVLLREWRERADLTQRELARQLQRPQSYVAKVERGSRRIDPVEWIAILSILGVSVEDAAQAIRRAG